jgi:hypothetical protein
MGGAGATVGLLLGGVLTDALDWRWVFFINIPIGPAVLAGTRTLVEAERHSGRLDVPGAITGTGGLIALVHGITRGGEHGGTGGLTLACFAAAALLPAVFLVIQWRAADPMMPLRPRANASARDSLFCSTMRRSCVPVAAEGSRPRAYPPAGRARLSALEALLARNEGDYLPDRTAQWVAERRREPSRQTVDALSSAAELALRLHRYGDAVRLCERAIAIDPLREVTWRVRTRAANAPGDDDGVLTAFQGCETALAQIDATLSPSTRKLFKRLQR